MNLRTSPKNRAYSGFTGASTSPLRILPAANDVSEPYKTPGTFEFISCPHCGGIPLTLFSCAARRVCAVCFECGCHTPVTTDTCAG